KIRIETGTFRFHEEFPDYARARTLSVPLKTQTCGDIFDAFLAHEEKRVARADPSHTTLATHRKLLDHIWRPHIGALPFLEARHSQLLKIADSSPWNKKTYNNVISSLRRAFDFGYRDYPERRDPAAAIRSAHITKKDRPRIDPFSIHDAEVLIAALHYD